MAESQRAQESQASEDILGGEIGKVTTRQGFEKRLGSSAGADDPWYDGQAYQATIIDTPRNGTRLTEGDLGDLSDDEAAQIVRAELEWNIFCCAKDDPSTEGVVKIYDFPTQQNVTSQSKIAPVHCSIVDLSTQKKPPQTLRFASVSICDSILTTDRHIATSIGKTIWLALADEGITSVPDDFVSRHLWFDNTSVIVWSRDGIAIASKSQDASNKLESSMKELADFIRSADSIANSYDSEKALSEGRELLKRIIRLQLQASDPHNSALRRLMDATRIDAVVATVTSLNKEHFDEAEESKQSERDIRLQRILAWGTGIGLLFAWNQVEAISIKSCIIDWHPSIRFIIGLSIASFFVIRFIKHTKSISPKL